MTAKSPIGRSGITGQWTAFSYWISIRNWHDLRPNLTCPRTYSNFLDVRILRVSSRQCRHYTLFLTSLLQEIWKKRAEFHRLTAMTYMPWALRFPTAISWLPRLFGWKMQNSKNLTRHMERRYYHELTNLTRWYNIVIRLAQLGPPFYLAWIRVLDFSMFSFIRLDKSLCQGIENIYVNFWIRMVRKLLQVIFQF